jgi:tetratricopeptide (TPR) repeat protein/ferredoxin
MAASKRSGSATPCGGSGPARSRTTRWRAAVLILVHLLFAAHLAHWLSTGRTVSPIEPSEAMEFVKHSVVNAGLVFFALTILSTLVLGRWFCGWGCHLVALQDLSRGLLLRAGIRPRPLRARLIGLAPMAAALYMFAWPAVARLMRGEGAPPASSALVTADFWATFPGLAVALATFVVCGFGTVYFLGAKGFCTYGCPYGAVFGVADRLAPARIRVTDACEGCGHCSLTCSSNVDVAREVRDYGMVVDPGCMKCLDCVSVCPNDALYFGFGRPALGARPRRADPRSKRSPLKWGEEALLAAVMLGALFVVRGLYGRVPFLFALGLASLIAFVALRAVQLARRPAVRVAQYELKSAARLTRAGRVFAGAAIALFLLVAHSAWIQFEGARSARAFERLRALRDDWFTPARPALGDDERRAAREVLAHGGSALRFGLLDDARRRVETAWASLVLDDAQRFRADLAAARAADPRAVRLSTELGHEARARGAADAAVGHYRIALERSPGAHAIYGDLVDVLGPLGRVGEVLTDVRRGAREQPRDPFFPDLEGKLLLAVGDVSGALGALRRALALEPESGERRKRVAQLLFQVGSAAEGLAVLRGGVEVCGDDPEAWRMLAEGEEAFGDPLEAARAARRALAIDPEHAAARALLERLGQ